MKQTAVEFLIKEFSDILGPLDTKPMQDLLMMDAMKKAKAMEKEQIMDSYRTGVRYALISESDLALTKGKFPNPTEFYNETFKS